MIIRMTIPDEIRERCRMFAEESCRTQQAIEFGQRDTAPRKAQEVAQDTFLGKLGEVAVAHFLRRKYGIHAPLDWEVYPAFEADDCDIQIKAWSIDVKTTARGKWLLFDSDKMLQRLRQGNVPDAVIGCRCEDGKTVYIMGAIATTNLLSGAVLKKGDYLPGTECRLQADNYGIQMEKLNNDWDKIVKTMITQVPRKIYLLERGK